MTSRHVVVDGSNIATESRSMPSLSQLDLAVRQFQEEHPDTEITVVVDATFGHRIDESERAPFEEAEAHGEVVSPPAGAIGRGDAFLLLIAERTGAIVLSNDSFQEFHGEHEWLFDKGRLIGGKPVPGVGWIFTPRTPVRGPKSREATKEARRHRVRVGSKEASQPMPVPKVPPPATARARKVAASIDGSRQPGTRAAARTDVKVRKAIAAATKEVEAPDSSSAQRRRRRRGAGPPPQAVNEPLAFITFVAEHPLGSEMVGEVESFTSHGAFVAVDGARAYVPLSGLGDPAPTRARSVLNRGERRTFVLQALDPQRRGLELALPEFVNVAGSPSEETVEAEIAGSGGVPRRRGGPAEPAKSAKAGAKAGAGAEKVPEPHEPLPSSRRSRKRAGPAPAEVPTPAPLAAADAGAPAKPRRSRKKSADQAPAPADASPAPAPAESPAPTPAKRSRKRAASSPEKAAPVPAKATRKKAASSPEAQATRKTAAASAPARANRKKAASVPQKAATSRETRATGERAATPAPAKATRKRAARAPEEAAAPAPAKATRKRPATPAPEERARKQATPAR
ncbi:MAG: NYN domain-containing protein [Acidimicrobiales bacterium]